MSSPFIQILRDLFIVRDIGVLWLVGYSQIKIVLLLVI